MDAKLADILKKEGLDDKTIAIVDQAVRERGVSLMYAIESTKKIPIDILLATMADYFGVQKVDLSTRALQQSVLSLVPPKLAESLRIVPIDCVGNNIIVACGDPKDLRISEKVRFSTGYFSKLVLASETEITKILQRYYRTKLSMARGDKEKQAAEEKGGIPRIAIKTRQANYDNEVMELADKILIRCFQRNASDIHIEPYAEFLRVRIRIDGALNEIARVTSEMRGALTARFKVMCGMDIAETRLPQDASLGISIDNVPLDFRVSTLPTVFGEKMVMRLLDSSALKVDMTDLGFERRELDTFRTAVRKPWGMVLVTGPTGSGKTTTLYSALADRNNVGENILTVEDPVEYNIEGINQVQTKAKIGLNFAGVLRSFLRQDPDVIMVGEIRDGETAGIAINAALTGHLVLSTLHTNNSYETVTRLVNMGVEPHNLVGALLCVVAQRLMRRLCMECRQPDDTLKVDYLVGLGIKKEFASNVKAFKPAGCKQCEGIGMRGRVAIHEVLRMTPQLYDAIVTGATARELKTVGVSTGMRTLRQAALIKIVQGVVSASEVARVTASDSE